VRLSITATLAADYLALRQADADIALLQQQLDIATRLHDMIVGARAQGGASDDDVLAAGNLVDAYAVAVEALHGLREQDEHAIAALLGVAPAAFTLAAQRDYAFAAPAVPATLPSQLLERRYDVVMAERMAAAANARIGVAKAAYFPNLMLSAQGALDSETLAHLLSYSNRVWSLGSSLAENLFDAGARDAAVEAARASYDADVANYRSTVIGAFQGVEDALSSEHHLEAQAAAQARILAANQTLYDHARAQWQAGAASEQSALDAQLLLLQSQQARIDTRAAWARSGVALIMNLGGGWQWKPDGGSAAPPVAAAVAPAGSRP
jgi:NodT family efflux transporter outer membrane factor (OMF) lipoprotein